MNLGPRTVYVQRQQNGSNEDIRITMTSELTHGEYAEEDPLCFRGQVHVYGASRDYTLSVYAVDEIQLVGRLMKLAGSALLADCEADGLELRSYDRSEPITDPYELF